jgi:hypothetical protein
MRRVALATCGLVLGWCVTDAAAGPGRLEPAGDLAAMQVRLVRSAEPGCEPQCPEWIAAQGRIEAGTAALFRRVLRQLGQRRVPVLIDSNGGRVDEAFEIGRLMRARGLEVVVGRTEPVQCAATDPECRRRTRGLQLGLPKADHGRCASSCAFILAAGTRRFVGPTAFVGVHQIRSYYVYARVLRTYRVTATSKQLVSERRVTEKVVETRTPQETYDQIRRYFGEMGVGEAIMPLILSTPGDQLHWLTREELQATGLATDWPDGEQLFTRVGAPAMSVMVRAAGGVSEATSQAKGAVPAAHPTQEPDHVFGVGRDVAPRPSPEPDSPQPGLEP